MISKRSAIAIALCGLAIAGGFQAAPAGAADNPIQIENAREGSWDWQRAFAAPAPAGSIDGYLGAISAAPGDTVTVHASTQPAATFRVEVFRIGWYDSVGGRLLTCAPGCATSVQGSPQSTPAPDPTTGLVRANWPTSTSFTVGSDWVSGYYVVNFVITSGPNSGKATWTPLVVTPPPDRSKQILVQATVTTWEAYNNWGGKSLYDYNSTGGQPAAKVSFDRPFATDGNTGMYDWEVPFVRWLEKEGYDVSYASDIDTHRNPALLQGYRLVMVNGHDEYWSTPIRNAFENAKAAGTNLAFFGANIGYWHIRFEDGERTMVGYKDAGADPITDPSEETVQFRDLVPARPECSLIGVQYMGGYSSNRTYTVVNAALTDPWMAGTGFTAGSTIPGVVGYEWDTIVDGCASGSRTVFFSYPGSPNEQLPAAHATRYVAPSGSMTFSTGTMDWALKLDPWSSSRDSRVEIFTRNALASLLSGGSPPPPDQPPTVSVTAPANNATVSGTVSVSATATDDTGVAGVQFKLDGVNLGSEDTTSPYTVSWNTTTATNGQRTLTATARDTANQTTTSATVTVTVNNVNQPPTVSVTAPANNATVSGTVSVSATATDDTGVAGVQFKLDGVNLGSEDLTSPYSVSWNTTGATNGQHTLTATARDTANQTTTSATVTVTVNNVNQPPTVSVTAPANNATVSKTVTVRASASDDTGVAGVQFKLDGVNLGSEDTTSPYTVSWNTTTATNGQHTLTATARDTANQTTTSATVTVNIVNQPPTVSVTQPANNATVSGTVSVRANASDDTGVAGVQFKLDGVNLGSEDLTSPYSVSWNTTTASNGQHTLTATARDTANQTTTSTTVTVTVSNGVNQPPTVSVTAPANNATVSGTVSVSATATDDTGVAGVQFKLDGVNLGSEDLTSPYSVSWNTTTASNGQHTLTATARDTANQTTTSTTVTVTVSNGVNQPPTVSVTQPANNATVSGTVSVRANASDDTGVAGVQFKLDGVNLGSEDTTSPYSVSWNTTTASNGQHTLTATARDTANQTTTSATVTVTVNNVNQPPTVSVTAPANNATVSGTVSVTASASDDTGVAGVQFKLDGVNLGSEDLTSPYSVSWNTTTASNGQHTLTATARDTANQTTTSTTVTVTVNNVNQPPTVSVTAPANNATVSGTVSVTASASDDTGVAGVQFKLDGVNLGSEDLTSPYSVSWDTTTASNGQHTLTATARDTANQTTTSTTVTVTVSNSAPPSGGAQLIGSASAGDNGWEEDLVFNLPQLQSGDQIVVGIQAANDSSFVIPTGWTVVTDYRPSTSWDPRVVVLRRAAVAGESTVTIPTGYIGKTGVAIAYRGLDPTAPVIATTTASVGGTSLTVPGLTPGVLGARLVFFTAAQGQSTAAGWTPPSGMTEVGDVNTLQWISIAADEQLLSASTATGTRTAVFGQSSALSGVLVALRPASP